MRGWPSVPPSAFVFLTEAGSDAANKMSSRIDTATDRARSCPAAGVCSRAVSAGMTSAATDSSSISETRRALVCSKNCLPFFAPPTTKARPSTSRTFARIEPTIVAVATS